MTEERKQELRRLLEEAMGSLRVRHRFEPLTVPLDEYRGYLEERWRYFGVDLLPCPSSLVFILSIVIKPIESNFLNFIREELAPFIDKEASSDAVPEYIQTASYFVEFDSNNKRRLIKYMVQPFPLFMVLERLLEITIVRGIEEVISVFCRCKRPEGYQSFFQDVSVVEGITLKEEIPIYKGVRLIPLPTSENSAKLKRYLPGSPFYAYSKEPTEYTGKTVLVVDRPGLSIFHKPVPDQNAPSELTVGHLPFPVEEEDAELRTDAEVDSFQTQFSQALSLVLNFPIRIPVGGWFLDEAATFNSAKVSIIAPLHFKRGDSTEAERADVHRAMNLFPLLNKLNAKVRKKCTIAIDRWIKSKISGTHADRILDLGIALEPLYVPDGGKGEITFKLAIRAAWYLGTDKADRGTLHSVFTALYSHRSRLAHGGEPKRDVIVGKEVIPISSFIQRVQDLCRDSILKMLKEPKFPDKDYWDRLVLGG